MKDKRTSSRTSADWPVQIITPEESMKGEVRNVSSTGAFIHCERPLNPKETCTLKIELPGGRAQEIVAEVVWSTPPDHDDESRPRGMGVKFLW